MTDPATPPAPTPGATPPARCRRVTVETPWRTTDPSMRARYLAYARAALADALGRGEAPYASHLLYTQPGVAGPNWCDDTNPIERARGLAAGLAWTEAAELVAVYGDLGVTEGMLGAVARAQLRGITVEYRALRAWADAPSATCGTCGQYDRAGGTCQALNEASLPTAICPLPPGSGWRPRPEKRGGPQAVIIAGVSHPLAPQLTHPVATPKGATP